MSNVLPPVDDIGQNADLVPVIGDLVWKSVDFVGIGRGSSKESGDIPGAEHWGETTPALVGFGHVMLHKLSEDRRRL